MTVSQIASLASTIGNTLGSRSSSSSAIAQSVSKLLTASGGGNTALTSDVSALADASYLQSQVSSLRVASQNIAQAQSLLAVADSGVSQISAALGQLQDLSARASSGSLSETERNQLNIEFQQLRAKINRIASTTQFNGQTLLDGSLDSNGGNSQNVTVGSLTTNKLFGDANPDLLSAQHAQAAEATIASAQKYVTAQQSNISALQEGLDYAAASLDSATQNQDASNSLLGLNDLIGAGDTSNSSPASFQSELLASLGAQTNRLPAGVLSLLTE